MNKSHMRKQAFTLTELLVVVIVIGILSAIVLPKFSKVLETRKTTEAEELLEAVRTEQEKRCILDHPYTGSFKALGQSDSDTPKLESKYYTYALKQGGAEAVSKGKTYTLVMESYKDGRVCCDGVYCSSLNKDYPLCGELKGRGDYQSAESACLASLCEVARQCSPGETGTKSCECGSQTRSCDGDCQWGSYTGTCYNKYGGTGETRACSSGCGTQTSVSTCSGESWSGSCWSPSGGRTETKSCQEIQSNLRGTATRYCQSTCSGTPSCPGWNTSGCSICSAPAGEPASQSCPSGYSGTQTRTWNTSTCSWGAWQGVCTCNPPAGEPTSQSCPSGYTGTQTRSWNTSTCSWGAWQGTCTLVPTCSDASYKVSHKSECCPSAPQSDSVCWKSPVWVMTWAEDGWQERPMNHAMWDSSQCPELNQSGPAAGTACSAVGATQTSTQWSASPGYDYNDVHCDATIYHYTCQAQKNGW